MRPAARLAIARSSGARLAVGGCRRVDLDEVRAQAQRHTRGTGDEVGGLLVRHGLAARVDPQNDEQTLGMSLGDELACLGQHVGLELAAQVDGVAQADDVDASLAHGEYGLEVVELRGVGILLGGLDQIGLGVHLDQVVDVGVVARVLGDETALAGEHADCALVADLEEMLGVAIGRIDALAVEVLVEMLDLLVAGKEHETAGAARGGHVVIEVELDGFGHDVSGNAHVLTGNLGHRVVLSTGGEAMRRFAKMLYRPL